MSQLLLFVTVGILLRYCVTKVVLRQKGCFAPKLLAEQELQQIEDRIAAYPKGIGITELKAALAAAGIVMIRRSLLRRLSILIVNNRIRATGAFKGRMYWPITSEAKGEKEPEESLIPPAFSGRQRGPSLCQSADTAS